MAAPVQATIEVDETLEDRDSAYGDDLRSYTTSIASSVEAYPWIHGRRFHAYKEGKYQFPNDDREQDRLDMVHALHSLIKDDKLFLAPLTHPKRILDIGTGTGLWAIQAGDEFPDAELIIGNDLSPIQPRWVPPNVSFEVDDVESEWPEHRPPFDLVHARYMAGSIQDWPALLRNCYKALAPGGWLECSDWDLLPYATDGSMPADDAVLRLHELLIEATDKLGRTARPGPRLEEWVKGAGFVNVRHERRVVPFGMWAKDEKLKKAGAINQVQFMEGVEAFTIGLFTRTLGWSAEEVQVFLEKVRKDAVKKERHRQLNFHIVYAQRPEA
ncbi:S-adenosyl-L-methionine-dependent methyltransferase [Macrophomina phaseolina]|uniref:S-adenosyl-L-methionine-dependent methyltransferase n=1 Tax=Macrophomina phaseolina TaxID=35725 RepID=A0ABQ8GJJ9_9PEZI|nr:S-adenosyl-L-methionine-dependent methyltransferase [Macrophomina phaseolina]